MNSNHLHILWTNADLDTSELMVFMYATNSMIHHWWKDVTIIIWGATAKLVAENEKIQERIKIASQAGVKFSACAACAKKLGVEAQLKELGLEVIYWGEPLTQLIKENQKLITI